MVFFSSASQDDAMANKRHKPDEIVLIVREASSGNF